MSFLFGKSKKGQGNALPAATRDISSSQGAESRIPTASSLDGPRDGMQRRGTVGSQQTPAAGSANSSFGSAASMKTPEPDIKPRARTDSDLNVSSSLNEARLSSGMLDLYHRIDVALSLLTSSQARPGSLRAPAGPPNESPYPWSTRQLQFSAGLSPFPRYGAAVNAAASKEGWIYMMGGLVNSQVVKGDLWMVELPPRNLPNASMACYPVNPTSEGPCPRVGHASLLVGNAFIVFGGDTKTDEGDVLDDTLYLLNTGKPL